MKKDKDKKKIEMPKLISDQEMKQLKVALPDPFFQQFKLMYYELIGKAERGEVKEIEKFKEIVVDKIDYTASLTEKLKKMVRLLNRESKGAYEKLRMQRHFLDKIKAGKEAGKAEEITGFPISKELGKKERVFLRPKAELVVDRDRPSAHPEPVIKEEPVQGRDKPSAYPDSVMKEQKGVELKESPVVKEQKLVTKDIDKEKHLVDEKSMAEVKDKDEERKEGKAMTHPALWAPLSRGERKKVKPKKKQDLGKYYKERAKRIKEYIQKDKMKGTHISYKEKINEDQQEED